MKPPPDTPPTHRLRGLVDGTETSFPLAAGRANAVGSSRSADVTLAMRGVSRRHARLTVEAGGLVVEDLGSLNGTFVDERRVERATVAAGDELRFGPVRLRLEILEPADAELAIVFTAPPAGAAPASTLGGREPEPTTQLRSVESLPRSDPHLVFPPGYLLLRSPAMAALYRQMGPLVRTNLPVLILGETGVGKELVARALHASGGLRAGAFVAVNCAAIPAELLEAEMFGIGKGVATGVAARQGKFQLAAQGTLLLDEIGEMEPALQAKLLRALQEKEICPLGGRPQKVDARIVAATNADLRQRIEAGHFRRDLYYRLAGTVLEVPALRQIRDEVPTLVEHFLRAFCAETGREVRGVTVKALDLLTACSWPGNVRQLENEVRRLVYQASPGQAIDSLALSPEIRTAGEPAAAAIPLDPLTLGPRLRELEVCLLREALKRSGGNQSQAARLLGITRNGLAKKIKRFGI